ncbi:hypothetical protein F3Y22_tig00110933pilonHSYRG00101 [Hibiscus syriacus]|uniref:Uncharacterized protein n=1 Tax=Hibiscus syriacus TaxID=106335 RepID=A0A6A2ZDT5_HIBSY|nr:hypothetical protein F3Y22_tig00110933pilonHSYRG00101 [Hibiscus syriacus]
MIACSQPKKEATATDLSLPSTEMMPTSSHLTGNKCKRKRSFRTLVQLTKSLSSMSDMNMNFADQQTILASNLPDLNGKGAISILSAEDLQVSHSEQSNRDGLPDPGRIFVPLSRPNMVSFASESKPGQKKRGESQKCHPAIQSLQNPTHR